MPKLAAMPKHSGAKARDHLTERTVAGEYVVTRLLTREDLLWMRAHRVRASAATDAGTLVSRMRDEDER